MKKISILVFILILKSMPTAMANSLSGKSSYKGNENSTLTQTQSIPFAFYSYLDFKFNSTQQNAFNRFNGHTKIYATGNDNVRFKPDLYAGFYLMHTDTSISSELSLPQSSAVSGSQSVKNYSLIGHINKQLHPNFFVDLSVLYGQSSYRTYSLIAPNTIIQQAGLATYQGHNFYAGLLAQYIRPWHNWLFNGNVSLNYNQANQDAYAVYFAPELGFQTVQSLRNKNLFSSENIEVSYNLKPGIRPFIGGGLIQVLNFSFNRSLLSAAIIGPIPQLSLDKNGYRLAAGVSLFSGALRIQQQYIKRSSIYHGNQTTVTYRVFFN